MAVGSHDHFQDITLTGNLSPGDSSRVTNDLIPSADNTEDLGSAALRWRTVHAVNLPPGISLAGDNVFTGTNAFDANAAFKGPNPYVDVTRYGVRAINPGTTPAIAGITAATATAGVGALPATPEGFLIINVAGTNRRVPYYNA